MNRIPMNNEPGLNAFALLHGDYDDNFFSLPEEIQEQVNAHANEFRSQKDMRDFIEDLRRRS